jgi:hypothetical protein
MRKEKEKIKINKKRKKKERKWSDVARSTRRKKNETCKTKKEDINQI